MPASTGLFHFRHLLTLISISVCFVVVAALGCIIYEVIKAHGSLSTALADTKADQTKAEATVESLITAAKKAV
ncbi:MAG: hypothetical protein ACLQVA_19140 [Candidatus Brocadiia bacterium]